VDKIKAPHACQVEYGLLKHFVCVFIDSVTISVTIGYMTMMRPHAWCIS